MRDIRAILSFWFEDLNMKDWFSSNETVDAAVSSRFGPLYHELSRPDTDHETWLATPAGSLALVLVLDQFPRNLFRNNPRAFESDALARRITEEAISRGHDLETHVDRRVFFYLPFEHSESISDQDRAISLIRERADISVFLDYAERHRDVIARFGRFPHRNDILGRRSTPEETAYLDAGGERF